MTGERNDPRPARSRARLLDAATALLRSGGPSAVTVDAVTRAANVARATLYRHFPSGNDLLAAAFHALIPPAPTPPAEGSLRDRLIALVQAQAELIAEAPVTLTAMSWLTLGGDLERLPGAPHRGSPDSPEVRTLRERVAEQYAAPFEVILEQPASGRRTRRRRPHQGGGITARPDRIGKAVHIARLRLSRDCGRRGRRLSGHPPQEGQKDQRSE